MLDALAERLLDKRKENTEDLRDYVKEAFYRKEVGLEQVSPQVHFRAPQEWQPPQFIQEVFDGLQKPETFD